MTTTPYAHLTRRRRRRPAWPTALLARLCAAVRALEADPDLWPDYGLAAACIAVGLALGWLL